MKNRVSSRRKEEEESTCTSNFKITIKKCERKYEKELETPSKIHNNFYNDR